MIGWLERRHPAQLILFAFALGIVVGTGLLLLPDTVGNEGDILVVAGETRDAEAFGELPSSSVRRLA